jgi:dienelactone hydrolase
MTETYIKILNEFDDIEIHGMLRGKFIDPLIILAPGLGGWMHDLQMFNASRYFEKQGFATLRLSFYGHDERQRNISDFGSHDCAADIDAVVDYVRRQGAKFVGVAGHSFSGLGIIYSKQQRFDTGILWDPTHTDGYDDPEAEKNLARDFIFIESLNSYVSGIGPGYVLSNKVFSDHGPGSNEAAKSFKKPLLVINADESKSQIEKGMDYVKNCPSESKHVVIPNSSHPFTQDGAMENLFSETTKWLNDLKRIHDADR